MVWKQAAAEIEVSNRLLVSPELVEENPALIQGVVMSWIELERVLKARQGLIQARKLNEDVAPLSPQLGVVRTKPYSLIEDVECFVAAPILLQHRCEARQIFGLGCALDRADDPLQRLVVLPGLEKQQPHEMLGVGVLGVDSEGLLVTGTRIEMPSVPEMRKARFAESGCCAHRCYVRGCH